MSAKQNAPTLVWFRRDLRLSDHAALCEAVNDGGPVIPVFLRDAQIDALGAAPKWRLGLSVEALENDLKERSSRIVYRSGDPVRQLLQLVEETSAKTVRWSRAYDPDSIERDTKVKTALGEAGIEAVSHTGHLLFQPWEAETQTGGFYRVYSPFWRNVKNRDVPTPLKAPASIPAPDNWPESERLRDWNLGQAMNRGAEIVAQHVCVGESAAQERLAAFVDERIETYKAKRNFPGIEATSRLSENLTYGEISPAQVWHAGQRAFHDGAAGAEHFLKELVWREFAYHLIYHTPHITSRNWREGWDAFPWRDDNADAERWRRGMTGEPMVDAGMRELYITGTMHNRVRMLVASYLCKHLMTHWQIGQKWFEDCLIDWDPASNAMGWQWVAGSGPDAAPYFRIFNPAGQAEKFDADTEYRARYVFGFQGSQDPVARSYFDAVPRAWNLAPDAAYPQPMVNLAEGRNRALSAYKEHTDAGRSEAQSELEGTHS